MLQLTEGTAERQIAQRFEPGQTVVLNWQEVAPLVEALPSAMPESSSSYRGPSSGTLIWNGQLQPGMTVVLGPNGVDSGPGTTIGRPIPGKREISVTVKPSDAVVELPPLAGNQWSQMRLRNSSSHILFTITIQWKIRQLAP
jgi:hypothetical protein